MRIFTCLFGLLVVFAGCQDENTQGATPEVARQEESLPTPGPLTLIGFDTLPDGTVLPDNFPISNHYASWGLVVSGATEPSTWSSQEAVSALNILVGGIDDSLADFRLDFVDPASGVPATASEVSLWVISAGDNEVTLTARDPAGNVLEAIAVSNPGTDVGWMNQDLVAFTVSGIASVDFTFTQPLSNGGDGMGIDDLRFRLE